MWADVLEAVRGTERDFTQGHMGKAVLLLSVPMVLEMLMESVFAIVDIYFVSRLGAQAIATVGVTESMITIVYALGIGLSTAATALVARRTGEKDEHGAARAALHAVYAGLMFSVVVSVVGVLFYRQLLDLMGLDGISDDAAMFTAIMLGGNASIMLLFIINAIFRSSGDAAVAMRVLWIGNLINIVLDPIFIFGFGPIPALGVKGAAIATTIGRGVAVLYQLWLLKSGSYRVSFLGVDKSLDFSLLIKVIRLAGGSVMQYLIATSGWLGLMRILTTFGENVVAGYTIAIRIIIFAMLPSVGRVSRYLAEAYLAVFSANSADVPPMTTARWYGGQAAVPSVRIFSSRNFIMASGLRIALVSWNR